MNTFQIRPEIHLLDKAGELTELFPLTERDLVFTSRHVYQNYFDGAFAPARVIFHTDYGTGEPSDRFFETMLDDIDLDRYDRIIAIGGGTILDTAKLLTLRRIRPVGELFDKKFPAEKVRSLILVPTTCGTGSEVTNVSILEFVDRHTKFGLAVDALYADHAVLIPELIEKLPFSVFATSSIDAFIHAIESYVSPKATVFSEMYSKKAMEMILNGYMKIAGEGHAVLPSLTKDFLTASCYGGIAFGNAGTGPVHAMSYPLSGTYHVPHGESNYVFFTTVFHKYQELKPDGKIAELNRFLGNILGCTPDDVYTELEKLFNQIITKKSLSEYGVTEEDLPAFAENVCTKQGRLMQNTYTPLSYDVILEMFRSLM